MRLPVGFTSAPAPFARYPMTLPRWGFSFSVDFKSGAAQTIRDWIKNGAKTRIKIHLEYLNLDKFGFPEEANCTASDASRRETETGKLDFLLDQYLLVITQHDILSHGVA